MYVYIYIFIWIFYGQSKMHHVIEVSGDDMGYTWDKKHQLDTGPNFRATPNRPVALVIPLIVGLPHLLTNIIWKLEFQQLFQWGATLWLTIFQGKLDHGSSMNRIHPSIGNGFPAFQLTQPCKMAVYSWFTYWKRVIFRGYAWLC